MAEPTIRGISPFFVVSDVPATLSFYRDQLGFEITFRGPTPDDEFFGIVSRGGAMIMRSRISMATGFSLADSEPDAAPCPGN